MLKIIGLGYDNLPNKILVKITEEILKITNDVDIIYNESDWIKRINKDDLVILMDCSHLGYLPSTVTMHIVKPECEKYYYKDIDILVYVILIECCEESFNFKEVDKDFLDICLDVIHLIKMIYEEQHNETTE